MKTAIITLSPEGVALADILSERMGSATVYIHDNVTGSFKGRRFASIEGLTKELFTRYRSLVYIAPCGIAVRALASQVKDKHTDPAVVVVDVRGRYAISLLSGHEGGANGLSVDVANILGAEPVITTTTEALKTAIIGIGCRKGVSAQTIVDAVHAGLNEAGIDLSQIRFLASADIKAHEKGLLEAARGLGIPLRFIPSREIRETVRRFTHSPVAQKRVNLPAVAEPAALLAGRRTQLILPKIIHKGVTIAIARESSS